MNILTNLKKQSKSFHLLLGFALVGAIGIVDFMSGYETAFSLFYLIPISLTTWFTNRRLGIVMSLVSTLIWVIADVAAGAPYSSFLIEIWNTLIRLSFFMIITLLLSALKSSTERERELARIDYLTGAANSRHFHELAQMEIDRLQRYKHPFTVAYFDLDNFKSLNDQLGHSTGDKVLRTVVCSAKEHLRKVDMIARLGGDEFAFLFPETDEASARTALAKFQGFFLEEMHKNNWSITLSIGVLTCKSPPASTDELVRIVDELMYSAKHEGKNAIKFSIYDIY